ncbi:MAG TPA: DUF5655 domain-containing protein [Nevskia sp.]|nr:DUF5655 domain-containing protein [Nevskia sp.]
MAQAAAYKVHPGVARAQAMVDKLPATTGRALDAWLALAKRARLADAKAIQAWLRQEHRLGTGHAGLIAEIAVQGADVYSAEAYLRAAPGYVDALFAGPKAALRPLYEELAACALGLGRDVQLSPCKTFVPVYRGRVMAQLKPGANTRLDLGLALGGLKAQGRLIDTGGFAKKDRITHRIAVSSAADIDAQTREWLARAYELSA